MDTEMEAYFKRSVSSMVSEWTEAAFIEAEAEVLDRLLPLDKVVLAPGGSIVYSEKAMHTLRSIGSVVYLVDTIARLRKRVADYDKRGLVGLDRLSLNALFEERVPLYKQYSHVMIEVGDPFELKGIVEKIVLELSK